MDSEGRKQIEEEYLRDNMQKLNRICRYLIYKKKVPGMYEEELYSIGRMTFVESIEYYDPSKNVKFRTYLMNNIWKAFYDWTRDNMRWKRCNFQVDKDGRIMRDQENRPIVIHDISLEAIMEEGADFCEKTASDFSMEDILSETSESRLNDSIEVYLDRLSGKQRKIVLLLYHGYSGNEIRELLHISKREYADCMLGIRAYENVRVLM